MCDSEVGKNVVSYYDPAYLIQYSDSTDFDDNSLNKKHRKRRKPVVMKTRAEKEFSITGQQDGGDLRQEKRNAIRKKSPVNSSSLTCHQCGSALENCSETRTPTNSQVEKNCSNPAQDKSKLNILMHKISSIFCTNKKLSPFVESYSGNKSKLYCFDCRRRQIRKYRRKHHQSVYLLERTPPGLLSLQTGSPDSFQILVRDTVSNTTSLSSNSEIDLWKEKLYRLRNDFEKENKKEYLKDTKEKEKRLKNQSQQYSKHDLYQVFANQNQHCQAVNSRCPRLDSTAAFGSSLPVTASSFWEFLINKLSARYQEAKQLSASIGCCCPQHCGKPVQVPELKNFEVRQNSDMQTQYNSIEDTSSQRPKLNDSSVASARSSKNNTSNSPLHVACDCNPYEIKQAQHVKKLALKSTQALSTDSKSCQEPHDDITKILKEKYNGEVLCIHNPPCVLINGCLNLPQHSIKSTPVTAWHAVTTRKRSSYSNLKKKKRPKIKTSEKASQYHPPIGGPQESPVLKLDKPMQSICIHKPPCQVMPGCFKQNYDPQLVYSCVHVPMCKKVPDCLVEAGQEKSKGAGQKRVKCAHKPKCFEVPECSRNYTVARGDVSMLKVCRHQPPCVMVPHCQEQVTSDSKMPYQCTHDPPCSLIPSCCRKNGSKDAVSTIRPAFNRGVKIKIPGAAVCQYKKLLKMVVV